jgi:hypothetical protein
MKSKLISTAIRYTLGTVIGFATLVSMMGVSFAQALTINSPNGKDISNVVLYVQTSSGITKVKIDNFSAGASTTTYNPTTVLQQYPGSQLVAYTIKAGNNKSNMGPGEGELVILNSSLKQSQLPTGAAQSSLEYTEVLKLAQAETPKTDAPPQDDTISNDGSTNQDVPPKDVEQTETDKPPVTPIETTTNTQPPSDTTNKVTVPEPATVAALGIFGLGAILKSKKKS